VTQITAGSGPSFTASFSVSFTTTAANEVGFALLSNSNGTEQTSVTMTNGWTLDLSALTGLPHSAVAHNALPTAGANSIQGSTSSADEWNVSILTLKPAVVAAPSKFPAFGIGALSPSPDRDPVDYEGWPVLAAEFRTVGAIGAN
jgi:hypothetical protein